MVLTIRLLYPVPVYVRYSHLSFLHNFDTFYSSKHTKHMIFFLTKMWHNSRHKQLKGGIAFRFINVF